MPYQKHYPSGWSHGRVLSFMAVVNKPLVLPVTLLGHWPGPTWISCWRMGVAGCWQQAGGEFRSAARRDRDPMTDRVGRRAALFNCARWSLFIDLINDPSWPGGGATGARLCCSAKRASAGSNLAIEVQPEFCCCRGFAMACRSVSRRPGDLPVCRILGTPLRARLCWVRWRAQAFS